MTKSKPFTPKEFVKKLDEFLKAVHSSEHVKILEHQHVVDLFRLWWMDFREQEAVEEARQSERGWGDMLDD